MSKPRIALALGGGGLRGIAHIGVLRALAEAEIQPTVYAGSSAGALVAAAAAYDLSLSEMERIAARLHRKSLFQIDVLGLLRYRDGCPVARHLRRPLQRQIDIAKRGESGGCSGGERCAGTTQRPHCRVGFGLRVLKDFVE
jgi:predicted acylesterase/phospholipase RssA